MGVPVADFAVHAMPLEQLAPAWSALAHGIPRPLPFHFPGWHRAWWGHFGADRKPCTLAVYAGDRLAAVLPLMRDGDTLALAGDPEICDYADLPITDSVAPDPLPALLDAVDALPWRTFHIWGLAEDDAALTPVQAWAEARGYLTELEFEAVCPRVTLPGGWDGYLAGLGKKDRHELKRKLRRFEEAGREAFLGVFTTPAEVSAALDPFFRLSRASHRGKAVFMTAPMEAFFREMAAALAAEGLLRVFEVTLDRTVVASLIAFVSGDELLLYNSGYDPAFAAASVGIASKALVLRAAAESGIRTFDFLRGAEPYKYDLGASDRIVRQLWIRRHAG